MNFYPYFTYFLVIILYEDEKELFEKIFNHLSEKIPYATVTLEDEKIYVFGGENHAYFQFIKMKKQVKKLKLARDIRYKVFTITSGSNHDMTYYPVFRDVELTMLQFKCSYIWKTGNLLHSIDEKETIEDFENVVKKLNSIIEESSNGITGDYSCRFMLRIKEVFPGIFEKGTFFHQILHGLPSILDDFYSDFSVTSSDEVPPDVIEKYKDTLPWELIYIWKEHGFAAFNNGLFKLINPDESQCIIDELKKCDGHFLLDYEFVILALTSFGCPIILERDNDQVSVYVYDIIDKDYSVLTYVYDFDYLFNTLMPDEETKSYLTYLMLLYLENLK